MKTFPLLLLTALMPLSLHAQEPAATEPATEEKSPEEIAAEKEAARIEAEKEANMKRDTGRANFRRRYSNLSAADQVAFAEHLQKASTHFRQKRIFDVLDECRKADAIIEDSPDVLNLMGAAYVEFRDFEKALVYFKRTKELSPESPIVRFNVAEIYFVTQEWEKCVTECDGVLELLPESAVSMRALMIYKKMLALMKLERLDEAKALKDIYSEDDDTPFAYYVDAAWHFYENNSLEADRALARGRRVFRNSPTTTASWDDTLIEYGYLQSFFGRLQEELDK